MKYLIGSKIVVSYPVDDSVSFRCMNKVQRIAKFFPAGVSMSEQDIDLYYKNMSDRQKARVELCKFDRYGTTDLMGRCEGIFPDNPKALFRVRVVQEEANPMVLEMHALDREIKVLKDEMDFLRDADRCTFRIEIDAGRGSVTLTQKKDEKVLQAMKDMVLLYKKKQLDKKTCDLVVCKELLGDAE